jgi:surface antigen
MKIVVPVLLAVSLAACSAAGTNGTAGPGDWGANKTTGGSVLGAIGGGLAGAQFGHGSGKLAATAAGALLGGLLGHEVGASLDRADQDHATRAEQKAYTAPVGQSIAWNNPDNGHSGTITPVRDGTDAGGRYCREFQQTIMVGGQTQNAYGTACRQPDGSWKVVSQ